MRFIRNIISGMLGGSQGKVDALHYFVTSVPAREKKRVLRVIVQKVNQDQKSIVEKGRGYLAAKS